ncbi:MAG TPA: histidinol dehydrogenase, partial [Thermoanaerobaculia bacterium]
MIRANTPEAEAALLGIESRRRATTDDANRVADEMIAGVRSRGDDYVTEQITRFDGIDVDPGAIRIEPRNVTIDRDLAYALDTAIDRVEAFHQQQLPRSYRWTADGTEVIHRVSPLGRVGIYAPGGRAVYVSTIIMCAVPARIAGVEDLVVATPPRAAARDELHYVCRRLGIGEIYRSGGAAAIAAMALGTATLRRVDKIAGPGNSFVTAAKARLIGEVGIDMTAGPTELVVIADETADAALVQADLDAQQEHGADSAVICISIGRPLNVRATLSLAADSVEEAVALSDRIAPEHLSIHARDAGAIALLARNAGAIYCGPWSPPAAGDYVIGSNHVLPTSGSARFFSPLGVYDFVRR